MMGIVYDNIQIAKNELYNQHKLCQNDYKTLRECE